MLLALTLAGACTAAESRNITKACRYHATVNDDDARRVTGNNYDRYWSGRGGKLSVTLPKGETAQGLQLSFYESAVPVKVEALDRKGHVTAETVYADRYLNAYLALPSEGAYRVTSTEAGANLRINRVQVFAGDTTPPEAQCWRETEGTLDLLHVVTHPDDELVWFGGLLPTYAGDRGMNVLVAYAATGGALKTGRLNELLDGLWVCGVTNYPVFAGFADFNLPTVKAVTNRWGETAAEAWCTGLIRRYRPKVVVTQDLRGESGHTQHKALAAAVANAVTVWSGDGNYDPESAALYGTYTPQKLYIHRYRQNEIYMEWELPLAAFGGKSSADVAREAFKKHVSQKGTHYHIYMSGPLDSRYFGLYFSRVGEDVKKDDLFENVVDE